jgi:hypothetical protein
MGDGDHINVVLPHTIDDTVREAWHDPLAISSLQRCAGIRAGGNPLCRLLHSRQEPQTQPVESAS